MNGVTEIIDSEECLTVYAENAGRLIPDIIRALDSLEIRLSSVTFSSPSLDDVFMKHTGRRIRTEPLVKAPSRGFGRRR
jgi:ABC-2 type transport system ATP-binding protein